MKRVYGRLGWVLVREAALRIHFGSWVESGLALNLRAPFAARSTTLVLQQARQQLLWHPARSWYPWTEDPRA